MQRGRKDRLASLSSGLAMAVLLGTLLGPPFWLLGLFRVIRISGYWRAVNCVRRGRVLIVANHPSLIETFLIPLAFWPWAMFRLRMFPWSLPDKNLFKVSRRSIMSDCAAFEPAATTRWSRGNSTGPR